MSIDDQILIGTPHDFRMVFKTYLQGLDTDIKFEEKEHLIRTEDIRWQVLATPISEKWSRELYEPVVGFRPTISMSVNLYKGEVISMRRKSIFAFFPLIEQINCDVAYVEDWFDVILRYKSDQLEIKTQTHFWQHSDLSSIPLPYVVLPDLPNF